MDLKLTISAIQKLAPAVIIFVVGASSQIQLKNYIIMH
jgi:hypothetical protein